jgi:molybdopterin converting factor small subunit
MRVKILPFGRFTDFMENPFFIEGASDTAALMKIILQRYPELKDSTFLIALNRQVITDNRTLQDNDEVALMPPFSGG